LGKTKKKFDEKLQEVRSHKHDKLRYRKRVQDEQEADKQLKEYESRKPER
jgi:hypothetical protein